MSKRQSSGSAQDSNAPKRRGVPSKEEKKFWGASIEDLNVRLRKASIQGNVGMVKILLEAGANVNSKNDASLQCASQAGHVEVVRILLEAGANVHAAGEYALQLASGNGHVEVVRVLLEAGANVHAGHDGALRWASGNGHVELVRILLEAGADPFSIKIQVHHKGINDLLDKHMNHRLGMIPLPREIAHSIIRPFLTNV